MTSDGGTASSVLGWISIACWVVVYSPQIIENYQLQSGEGLSIPFVIIWLLGDLCNLGGAVMANLLPTIIILGAYYSVCDLTLLFQIFYYRRKNPATRSVLGPSYQGSGADDECAPLLPNGPAISFVEPPKSGLKQALRYLGALLFVFASGIVAWYVSEHVKSNEPTPDSPQEVFEWRSQVLGYLSAALFLGSRIPQILKNFETHCEGLAPAMFLFSISGNTTYALSIIAASAEPKHLITNASWLAGSALTVFLDIFVLSQFVYYRRAAPRAYSALEA